MKGLLVHARGNGASSPSLNCSLNGIAILEQAFIGVGKAPLGLPQAGSNRCHRLEGVIGGR